MNKLEQAARQALGALVRAEAMYGQPNADIQTALRDALAEQAEQEPVEKEIAAAVLDHCYGYSAVNDDMIERTSVVVKKILDKHAAPQPVRTKDLTDDEISGSWYSTTSNIPAEGMMQQQRFARAVIAAYKEKNK